MKYSKLVIRRSLNQKREALFISLYVQFKDECSYTVDKLYDMNLESASHVLELTCKEIDIRISRYPSLHMFAGYLYYFGGMNGLEIAFVLNGKYLAERIAQKAKAKYPEFVAFLEGELVS